MFPRPPGDSSREVSVPKGSVRTDPVPTTESGGRKWRESKLYRFVQTSTTPQPLPIPPYRGGAVPAEWISTPSMDRGEKVLS